MILASLLSLSGYCQSLDSISQRVVNSELAKGLNCCKQLKVCDSIVTLKDDIITNLNTQLFNYEYKYSIKHGNYLLADSLYKDAAMRNEAYKYDNDRLKKGKRNWIVISLFAIGGLAYMLFK